MGKLEGKIALITGSGIGLATAQQVVNEGAYVFIMGRRDAELAAAVKEIGSNITGVQGDVSKLPISIACSRRSNGTRASLKEKLHSLLVVTAALALRQPSSL